MYRITIEETEYTAEGKEFRKVYRQVFRELDVQRVVGALNQTCVVIQKDGVATIA